MDEEQAAFVRRYVAQGLGRAEAPVEQAYLPPTGPHPHERWAVSHRCPEAREQVVRGLVAEAELRWGMLGGRS